MENTNIAAYKEALELENTRNLTIDQTKAFTKYSEISEENNSDIYIEVKESSAQEIAYNIEELFPTEEK